MSKGNIATRRCLLLDMASMVLVRSDDDTNERNYGLEKPALVLSRSWNGESVFMF